MFIYDVYQCVYDAGILNIIYKNVPYLIEIKVIPNTCTFFKDIYKIWKCKSLHCKKENFVCWQDKRFWCYYLINNEYMKGRGEKRDKSICG